MAEHRATFNREEGDIVRQVIFGGIVFTITTSYLYLVFGVNVFEYGPAALMGWGVVLGVVAFSGWLDGHLAHKDD